MIATGYILISRHIEIPNADTESYFCQSIISLIPALDLTGNRQGSDKTKDARYSASAKTGSRLLQGHYGLNRKSL